MLYLNRVSVLPLRSLFLFLLFSSILLFSGSNGLEAKEVPKGTVGETVFNARCAKCHGIGGAGTDIGPALVHRVYGPKRHGDFSFNLAVTRGVRAHHWRFGDMKRIEGVSREEIEAIVVYVRALQKEAGIY